MAEHSAAQVLLANTIIWPDTGASPLASCGHVHKPLASREAENQCLLHDPAVLREEQE